MNLPISKQKHNIVAVMTEIVIILRAVKGKMFNGEDTQEKPLKIVEILEEALSTNKEENALGQEVEKLLKEQGLPLDAVIEYASVLAQVQAEGNNFQGPEHFTTGRSIQE